MAIVNTEHVARSSRSAVARKERFGGEAGGDRGEAGGVASESDEAIASEMDDDPFPNVGTQHQRFFKIFEICTSSVAITGSNAVPSPLPQKRW